MNTTDIAVVASIATALGLDVMRGVATSAGASLWSKLVAAFGWAEERREPEHLPKAVAEAIQASPEVFDEACRLLGSESDFVLTNACQEIAVRAKNYTRIARVEGDVRIS